MKKILSGLFYLSIMMILVYGCSNTTKGEIVVTEEGTTITKSKVNVSMKEWDVGVDPNYKMGKHIKPGELTLTLKNEGNLEHNLVLLNNNKHEDLELSEDGSTADENQLDILGKIESIQPGETAELIINDLPAGSYAFICNTAGHYEQGMVYKFIAR